MKYYSEITRELYDDEKLLAKAELKAKEAEEEKRRILEEKKEKAQKLQEQRSARVKEVEDAYKIVDAAQKDADELLRKFLSDYGSFYSTVRSVEPKLTFTSFLNSFFS